MVKLVLLLNVKCVRMRRVEYKIKLMNEVETQVRESALNKVGH